MIHCMIRLHSAFAAASDKVLAVLQVQKHMKLHITKELTEKDVVSRIMRKENYLVGMLNKVGPWLTTYSLWLISDSTHVQYQCAPLLSWSTDGTCHFPDVNALKLPAF